MVRNRGRTVAVYLALAGLLVLLLLLNICIGSVSVPLGDVLHILFGSPASEQSRDIVLQLRLPRALSALILGGALALSGYLLQTYFHNPIAGPFILGISSGAKLLVAAAMILGLRAGWHPGTFTMVLAAFLGAMLSMSFVLGVSRKVDRMSVLIICGVLIGYICSAATDFMVTFADDSNIVNLHNWSKGSFSGIGWNGTLMLTVIILLTTFAVFAMVKPIGAYQMGESYARSVGVNVRLFRSALVVLSSLLAATVTAFAGPVSFVGVAVPHLMKSSLGTAKPQVLVPASFLGGGVFCLFCDLLARTLFAPTELSISTVTAVFGAPVVLWVLIQRKGGRE